MVSLERKISLAFLICLGAIFPASALIPPTVLSEVLLHTTTPLDLYQTELSVHPLETHMLTGGFLSLSGDAIAQSGKTYDPKRAASFVTFDMSYRALQHYLFPYMNDHLHGQYLSSIFHHLGGVSLVDSTVLAALEGTFANQLIVVPLFYYPIFFTVTALVQGISASQGWERAKIMFLPLIKRNLIFWIPIQFVQFKYVPQEMQIPFVCLAGLVWTIVLSVLTGNSNQAAVEASYVRDAGNEQDELQAAGETTAVPSSSVEYS